VETVRNGDAALRASEQGYPHAVLFDLHIPILDGLTCVAVPWSRQGNRLADTGRTTTGKKLSRRRAFLTLAVGFAGSTTTFSIVYTVLLRPLPYPQPERLVAVSHTLQGISDAKVAIDHPCPGLRHKVIDSTSQDSASPLTAATQCSTPSKR
jgi:hypothetical protein